jgi:hypothetical protein
MELPESSYAQVRDRIEHKRQRAGFGLWGTAPMSRAVRYAVAVAAVALVAAFGYQLVGSPNLGGPGPSVSPSANPSSATEVTEPAAALAEGPWVIAYEMLFGVRTTVTIPAPDWYGLQYETHVTKFGGANPPLDARLVVFGGNLFVYGDPCAWESTRPDQPAASLDELVAALSAQASQASRDATKAVDWTVGGYPAKTLVLRVPEDAEFANCDGGEFRTLVEVSSSGEEAAYANWAPGQRSQVWIVDVDGTLVYFEASSFEGTPDEYLDEMQTMVESATFELARR